MMEILETKCFDNIIYIDENHSYWIDEERLTSVTQYLSKFKQPFDTDRWSKHSAAKEGVSQQTILERWDQKSKISLEKGTIVHNAAELILKGEAVDLDSLPVEVKAIHNFWKLLTEKYQAKALKTEWIVGDQKAKIAGRVDAIIQFIRDGVPTTSILDWKTGTIKMNNHFGKMKPPFADYDDCAFNHYSIQLSLYRLILEHNLGIKMDHGLIVNATDNGQLRPVKARDFRSKLERLIY